MKAPAETPGRAQLAACSLAGGRRPSAPRAAQLSRALAELARRAEAGALTLDEALLSLRAAPSLLVCAVLCLPFCQPVPLLGLSMPLGLAMGCFAGSRLLNASPRVPASIGRRLVPARFFPSLLKGTSKLVAFLERFLRPRIGWLARGGFARLCAGVIVADAAMLMLPLPVPFSNTLPACSALALCLGLLEEDGVAILAGFVLFFATICFFATLGYGSWALIERAAS